MTEDRTTEIEEASKNLAGAWICIVLGVFATLSQIYATYWAVRSNGWPTAPGRVLTSEVKIISDAEGESIRPRLIYQYRVADTLYSGDRLSYQQKRTFGSKKDIDAFLARYCKGCQVAVHYNPQAPGVSVLEPGASLIGMFGLIVGPLLLLFGCGLLWQRRRAPVLRPGD